MSARHPTAEKYIEEIDANRDKLRGPKDGTVCYTNRGEEAARAHVAQERAEGRDAIILEQTEYGRRLDDDNLWDVHDHENRAFNQAELARQKANGKKNGDPQLSGTKLVWGHTSKTYAEQAEGMVTVVTNDQPINERGFFANHERAALIRNEKVTSINGVERKELEIKLDALEQAKVKESAAISESEHSKAAADSKKALESLNTTIENGDPTRKKSVSEAGKGGPGLRPESEPNNTSPWDRHKKSGNETPVRTMKKTK